MVFFKKVLICHSEPAIVGEESTIYKQCLNLKNGFFGFLAESLRMTDYCILSKINIF